MKYIISISYYLFCSCKNYFIYLIKRHYNNFNIAEAITNNDAGIYFYCKLQYKNKKCILPHYLCEDLIRCMLLLLYYTFASWQAVSVCVLWPGSFHFFYLSILRKCSLSVLKFVDPLYLDLSMSKICPCLTILSYHFINFLCVERCRSGLKIMRSC